MATEDAALKLRIQELLEKTPDAGYRAVHAALQGEDAYKGVGIKKVQKIMRDVKEDGYSSAPVPTMEDKPTSKISEISISRPNLDHKFGMLIGTDKCPAFGNGHAVTEIRDGGVVASWNKENSNKSIDTGDIIMSVNGKTLFDGMMDEFRTSLTCILRIMKGSPTLKEDFSEAQKEAAEWKRRKERVTAALIPGLKKIVESEFGPGASQRIQRVDDMYQRVGRDEVKQETNSLGERFAPGYVEGLTPVSPFHDTKDYPFCAEFQKQWKEIREELRNSLDEKFWTPGAYQSSNEAYGKDWKIMGVFTADKWQDEERFKVTSKAIKALKGIVPTEAFFARMPAHTKIAPHSDNLNYVLTSHLALELEEGKCSIKCGSQERDWKEGEMLVLDTSFIHSTKNESDRARYVLVLRFWHPGLSDEERRAIHLSHQILAATGK
eukprot:TRINITY_DN16017_c0_g1_i2.p1 TRINITY_DN16017_c0_g1~~TRINITY_DN16017_c0_g1_i2.p1  ORF type:complete len:436 (-),score=95.84 TRINITY_DN16017_c0_g1_i2:406-1713(-)